MEKRIRCFLLERTDEFQRQLRRFTFSSACGTARVADCPARPKCGHDATRLLDVVTITGAEAQQRICETPIAELEGITFEQPPADDPRWPATCDACGYAFEAGDESQANAHRLYRTPSGDLVDTRNAPAGAMWFVPWYDRFFRPQLEHCIQVMLPNGCTWVIDSQANNCTIPDDRRQERHHCWTIEGELPDITAGKRQPTCNAGGGSILAGNYHGFLRAGYLEEC